MQTNYQVLVRGPLPGDLPLRISTAHAAAILRGQGSSADARLFSGTLSVPVDPGISPGPLPHPV